MKKKVQTAAKKNAKANFASKEKTAINKLKNTKK